MVGRPLVSVVIPAYNSKVYAADAVRSLLSQTLSDLEVIVVDDGSSYGLADYLSGAIRDARLRIITHSHNMGVAIARNTGIAAANGEFIAFLDADDLSMSNRIEKQVEFLEGNICLGATGSSVSLFGDVDGNIDLLCDYRQVAASTMFSCEFLMPSLMVRRSTLDQIGEWFKQDYGPNCDWEFVARIAMQSSIANLPDRLVAYRKWEHQMSAKIVDTVCCPATKLRSEMLEWFGIPRDDQDLAAHIVVAPCYWPLERRPGEAVCAHRAFDWLQRIHDTNLVYRKLDQDGLDLILKRCELTINSARI